VILDLPHLNEEQSLSVFVVGGGGGVRLVLRRRFEAKRGEVKG
jgi:hypothetical protein